MASIVEEIGRQDPALGGLEGFAGATAHLPNLDDGDAKRRHKVCASLEEAVRRSGLRDGMTISFHHAFREGDKVINQVVDLLARMGFKDLTLASSSLLNCHDPLVEHIRSGVITQIFTSGLRGRIGEAVSNGLLAKPVQIHSHGGRANLLQTGQLRIDVAFLGVSCSDEFGNASGSQGRLICGSLGYAKVDAEFARTVVLLTQDIAPFPNHPASIAQDQVDLVVAVEEVGDPKLISMGAARTTNNPRELLIASYAADVVEHSGCFRDGFSLQTGSGASSIAAVQYLEDKMTAKGIKAGFALGGITGSIARLHAKGLIRTVIDVQSFDSDAAESLRGGKDHVEISANQYANGTGKGAYVDRVDAVILAALEIDTGFNVNVLTGSDGVLRGASGGHCDVAAAAGLTIIVAPLVRGRIPTVVEKVTTVITPGESVDVLVTDQGVAVNPARPDLAAKLQEAGLPVVEIEELHRRAIALTGEPEPLRFLDRIVAVVRYRDGTVIDVVRQVDDRS